MALKRCRRLVERMCRKSVCVTNKNLKKKFVLKKVHFEIVNNIIVINFFCYKIKKFITNFFYIYIFLSQWYNFICHSYCRPQCIIKNKLEISLNIVNIHRYRYKKDYVQFSLDLAYLWFISRFYPFKILYCTFVRSDLEYCSF